MCGIVGSSKSGDDQVRQALDVIAHRGPDQFGYSDLGPTLGHRRLSIIDLSEGGKQPMSSSSGRTTIVFNGEIYNYQQLKAELVTQGILFANETDTEVIVAGYEAEGIDFFNKLRGMWAFAIWDSRSNELILSRDQFGIKPLYYTTQGGDLYFASELKTFSHFPVSLRPNTESYFTFFNLGYFCAPNTQYESVYALEPGQILTYSLRDKRTKFSSLRKEEREVGELIQDTEQATAELDAVLRESLEAHYIADVPVGLLFSGGGDSSLLAALSCAIGKDPLAFHLAIEGSVDTEYARKVGRVLGVKAEFIDMTNQELSAQYEKVWSIVDAPIGDLSIIPTSLIYQKIKGKSKVILSGEGGDEWFGGYHRHHNLAQKDGVRLRNVPLSWFYALYGTSKFDLKYRNPIVSRLRDCYLRYGTNDAIGQYLRETKEVNYPFNDQKMRAVLYDVWQNHRDIPPSLLFDEKLYLTNDLLYKNDMASMASSVEARVPLVDKRVSSFVHDRLSPELRLSPQYRGKYLLKKVLERYLPEDLVYRRKSGFSFSFTRYNVPAFKADLEKALQFHSTHAEEFGIQDRDKELFSSRHADVLTTKYPRFAFGLVSNWKIWNEKL
jgi:asparagine synthase (glutamine-hydrolysing)